MKTELREKIIQLIGEYSASIMVDNPRWIFDPKPAIKLADSILESCAFRRVKVQEDNNE